MTDFAARHGPSAIVTGASSGIGRAFVDELAARGLDLVLVARRVVLLSLLLPASISRWSNAVFGLCYTVIEALTLKGAPPFYILFRGIEMPLTLAITVVALRWPNGVARN